MEVIAEVALHPRMSICIHIWRLHEGIGTHADLEATVLCPYCLLEWFRMVKQRGNIKAKGRCMVISLVRLWDQPIDQGW